MSLPNRIALQHLSHSKGSKSLSSITEIDGTEYVVVCWPTTSCTVNVAWKTSHENQYRAIAMLTGIKQGGILSPILSNVCLDNRSRALNTGTRLAGDLVNCV